MTPKKYLLRIGELKARIRNKDFEIKDAKKDTLESATSVTSNMSSEKVQSSGSTHKMADTVDSGIDRVNRLKEQQAALMSELDSIIATIETLPREEYDILHRVYVQEKPLKVVAVDMRKSYSRITTLHGIALKKVGDILREKEKDNDGNT